MSQAVLVTQENILHKSSLDKDIGAGRRRALSEFMKITQPGWTVG